MQESGNLKITFANKEQAAVAYPIVKDNLVNYEFWSKALTMEENIIKVEPDIHMYTDDYPWLVLTICKEIASKNINFEFDVEANCCDDEGFYFCNEKGHFKHQTFYFKSYTITLNMEEPDFNEMDEDEMADWNPFDDAKKQMKIVITKGKVVDGKLIFK